MPASLLCAIMPPVALGGVLMGVAFDTLKFVEKLEAGGFTHGQAKATAEAFAEATSQELATKADITAIRADVKNEIAAIRADVKNEIAAIRADVKNEMAAVRAELKETETRLQANIKEIDTRLEAKIETSAANLKVDILRWLVVTQIGLAGFIFAAVKFLK